MRTFIVFALLVAAVAAYPGDREAEVLNYQNTNIGTEDGYVADFETSNGIKSHQEAAWTNAGTDNEGLAVRGEYSYVGDDAKTYKVTYVADQNGYQPSAPFIPK